jgi:hypothetical protein
MLVKMVPMSILWTIGVVNTELLIKWSYFQPDSDARSNWQFGQVEMFPEHGYPFNHLLLGLAAVLGDYPVHGYDGFIPQARNSAFRMIVHPLEPCCVIDSETRAIVDAGYCTEFTYT